MRRHQLKMNPLKCAFGVSAGNFLGFLVHQRGSKKIKQITSSEPKTKRELQSLLGPSTANLAGKTQIFTPLLKLRETDLFVWEEIHQKAFEEIKTCLTNPPVMMPPRKDKPRRLYIEASYKTLGAFLAQENDQGCEQAVYYLSRVLQSAEKSIY